MITNTGDEFDGVVDAQIVDLSNKEAVWQGQAKQKVAAGVTFWSGKSSSRIRNCGGRTAWASNRSIAWN